jgi:hypothetical protein
MSRLTFDIHLSGDGDAVRRARRPGMRVVPLLAETLLTTVPLDQAGLHAFLGRLTDFGIELLELGPAGAGEGLRPRPETGKAGSPSRVSYEICVGGAPSPAVLAALEQRASALPGHVAVVVEAGEGDLVDILGVIAVPGVQLESARATPALDLPAPDAAAGSATGRVGLTQP